MIHSICKHFTLLLCNYYLSIQNVKISIKYFVICNIYVMPQKQHKQVDFNYTSSRLVVDYQTNQNRLKLELYKITIISR